MADQAQTDLWAGLASLRYVFLGGEPISMSRLCAWIEAGGGNTMIVNTYGPTECTDVSAFYTIKSPRNFLASEVPIGRPIPNSRLFVLDGRLSPVPPGIQGELYIGGVPVGGGYIGNPELTAKCFQSSPFDGEGLLYRTGDLAEYLPDGTIQLRGRMDQQIKIRGFRIEPGEIERTLAEYPAVHEAVVAASIDPPGDERLAAYLVLRGKQQPTSRDLRDFLCQRLPGYMIPSAFAFLDRLPRTPSGKLDRHALQAVRPSCPEICGRFVAPRTPTEQALAAIWAELLGVEQVGIHDNIFELGGHSLLMVKAISRIRSTLGVEVSIRQLFDAPTIADLAAGLVCDGGDQSHPAAVAHPTQDAHPLPEEEPDRVRPREAVVRDITGVHDACLPAAFTEERQPRCLERAGRRPGERPAAKIQSLVFPTAGRVDSLRECMSGFAENCREHDRDCDYIVADDGANADVCRQCRRMLLRLQSEYKVRVFYAGPQEKHRFAEALVETCGLPAEVVHFGLFDLEGTGTSTGANRNALLLATVGEAVFSADDDTLCIPSIGPRAGESAALAVDRDPAHFWVFPDRATAMRQATASADRDLLGDHERFLGRFTRDVLTERTGGDGLDCDRVPPHVKDRLEHADSRILVTLNGLLGDCGWNSPFSYLLWTGASHARLVESEECYRQACTSREILRVVDRPTVSDATFVMSTFMGLDNRELLPPFLPVMRGQDHVFGQTVWQGLSHGWFAHLPVALVHRPAEVRRFRPGETIRGVTGLSLFRVFLECIRSVPAESLDGGDPARLRAVGNHLMSLGRMPVEDFDHLLRQWVRSSGCDLVASLRERLRSETAAPRFWAGDLARCVSLLEESLSSKDHYVPLDLMAGGRTDEARQLTHRLVSRFGQLLYWWPSIVDAAKELRRRGLRLVQPVEEVDDD